MGSLQLKRVRKQGLEGQRFESSPRYNKKEALLCLFSFKDHTIWIVKNFAILTDKFPIDSMTFDNCV